MTATSRACQFSPAELHPHSHVELTTLAISKHMASNWSCKVYIYIYLKVKRECWIVAFWHIYLVIIFVWATRHAYWNCLMFWWKNYLLLSNPSHIGPTIGHKYLFGRSSYTVEETVVLSNSLPRLFSYLLVLLKLDITLIETIISVLSFSIGLRCIYDDSIDKLRFHCIFIKRSKGAHKLVSFKLAFAYNDPSELLFRSWPTVACLTCTPLCRNFERNVCRYVRIDL